MSLFDGRRLTQTVMRLDVGQIGAGYFSDQYFNNVVRILQGARADGAFKAMVGRGRLPPELAAHAAPGGERVEAQVFTRRMGETLVVGVDAALTLLRHAAGYQNGDRGFVQTWRDLSVEAIADGDVTLYAGDTQQVMPVLRIRGRYQDFAVLETPILGYLTRASRVATNTLAVMRAAAGKPILFFPARFDLPDVQALDGYAYFIAVQRFNHERASNADVSPVAPIVSTDAQGAWWGGTGSGTIPHALIACFYGDTAEAMCAYAAHLPPFTRKVALIDFENDCVGASVATATAFWQLYRQAWSVRDAEAMQRWTLHGVRLDTSGDLRDRSLTADEPTGVNAVLVRRVRDALDRVWESWAVSPAEEDAARAFCRSVQIIATGGFSAEKIAQFERDSVPVDAYGVGSALLRNDSATTTDFTMDVVRVEIAGRWHGMAKVGRRANDNPALQPVDLTDL